MILKNESKYAIIINFSPENKAERDLCNSLVSRLFVIFCNNNQDTIRRRATYFSINDADKLGEIVKMHRYVSVGRSFNIHIDLSFEDIEHVEKVYGHVHTQIIEANMNINKVG